MTQIFTEVLYRPIFNLLVLIYNLVPGQDFGLAIIILTVLMRLALMPLSVKALRSQKMLTGLQPKLKEVQVRFKNDKAAQAQATMALYKENKINPVAGCLPLLIQLPILLALYQAFLNGFKPESLNILYGFITNPGVIEHISLKFFDLAKASPLLVISAGILQFIQSKLSLSKQAPKAQQGAIAGSIDPAAMSRQMLYFFPIMIIIIGWKLPAGLVLYWSVTTLFSIFEQLYINKTQE